MEQREHPEHARSERTRGAEAPLLHDIKAVVVESKAISHRIHATGTSGEDRIGGESDYPSISGLAATWASRVSGVGTVTIVLTTSRQLFFGSGLDARYREGGSTTVGGEWFELLLIGALILLNGALSGSEVALISLREGQLRKLERQGTARARTLVGLARDPTGISRRYRSVLRWPGTWRRLPPR